MTIKNGDLPAMPCSDIGMRKDESGFYTVPLSGLSKREQFAAMAMQGLLSSKDWGLSLEGVVSRSVYFADALLVELEKSK